MSLDISPSITSNISPNTGNNLQINQINYTQPGIAQGGSISGSYVASTGRGQMYVQNTNGLISPSVVYQQTAQPVIYSSNGYQNSQMVSSMDPKLTMTPTQIGTSSTAQTTPIIRTVKQTKYMEGDTIYETVHKDAYDPSRESIKKLYVSQGYTDKQKGMPCCAALLGLLLLAGLIIGGYFLVKAIDNSAGDPPTNKPTDINFITNTTPNTNATNITTVTPIVTPPIPTIPPVINSNQTTVIPTPIPQNTTDQFSLPPIYTVPSTPAIVTNSTPITPIPPTSAISVGPDVSQQLYFSDPNIQIIDQYLRETDAYRLGNDPVLTNLALQNQNGSTMYYLTESTNTGKNYLYGVTMVNGQPTVQSVSISQSTTPTTHGLQVKNNHINIKGNGQKLRTINH